MSEFGNQCRERWEILLFSTFKLWSSRTRKKLINMLYIVQREGANELSNHAYSQKKEVTTSQKDKIYTMSQHTCSCFLKYSGFMPVANVLQYKIELHSNPQRLWWCLEITENNSKWNKLTSAVGYQRSGQVSWSLFQLLFVITSFSVMKEVMGYM